MHQWRKAARSPVLLSPEAVRAVADAFDRTEPEAEPPVAEALRQCLDELPDHARRLLRLRYEQALDAEQIADRINGTPAAIYKTLSRLRALLRKCIERRLAAELRAS
jgi:RNA polymerase sigma factor (sigma-70 family)